MKHQFLTGYSYKKLTYLTPQQFVKTVKMRTKTVADCRSESEIRIRFWLNLIFHSTHLLKTRTSYKAAPVFTAKYIIPKNVYVTLNVITMNFVWDFITFVLYAIFALFYN